MATEKCLKDANALIAEFEWLQSQVSSERAIELNDYIQRIKDAPTVDAVEVVRCDDCIHYRPPDEGDFLGLCTSGMLSVSNSGEIYPVPGFYCLYGERKYNVL